MGSALVVLQLDEDGGGGGGTREAASARSAQQSVSGVRVGRMGRIGSGLADVRHPVMNPILQQLQTQLGSAVVRTQTSKQSLKYRLQAYMLWNASCS